MFLPVLSFFASPLVSIGSEHGMKIYNERVQLLGKILENWQLGREVEIITKEKKDILESKEDKVFIIMPPEVVKRCRPKGTEMTVIALVSRKKTKFANKTQKVVTPFSKLRPIEKDRLVLECFAKLSAL